MSLSSTKMTPVSPSLLVTNSACCSWSWLSRPEDSRAQDFPILSRGENLEIIILCKFLSFPSTALPALEIDKSVFSKTGMSEDLNKTNKQINSWIIWLSAYWDPVVDDHHKVLVLRDGPAHIVQSPLESFMSAVNLYHLLEDESFIIFMNILRGRLFMFVLTGD